MGENKKRWIVRDASGRISGPYTTEKILYKIGRGEFFGEESIAFYPDGKWIPISQDPQFYDKLLDVLSKNEDQEPSIETRVLEFTRPQSQPDISLEEKRERPSPPVVPEASEPQTTTSKKKIEPDIELVDVRPQVWKELLKRAKWPILVGATGLVVAWFLLGSARAGDDRIHLIMPQDKVQQVPLADLKERIHGGVSNFLRDTFSNYIQAENEFVYTVERTNKAPDVEALLCMTYLQLWPYAHEDARDARAISRLVQLSSTADPGGIQSAACRVVDLIVRARYQEAKSLVESTLESQSNDLHPAILFYFLKGYLLEEGGDHTSAVGYLQTAEQLWPQWTLPFMLEAEAQAKVGNTGKAATIYRRILKSEPGHTQSRLELGLLEYKFFQHYDVGSRLLNEALSGSGTAPHEALSRGFFGLAEISLHEGNQAKALKYAQKAFSLNSSNTLAKNLIVQLGGVEKLRDTKVKGQQLLFEGDQFFREGDCQAAQAHYKAAFEEDPKNARAALKAAQCLWKLSFSTEAIAWLQRAVQADPTMIEAYVTMADYYTQRYNFLAAAKILSVAKRENPKSAEVYRGFALVELRRGNASGAITFGKMALKLYENDVKTQILMAKATMALNDYRMAYNYAAKAIEIDVNNREAQIVYAQALAGLQGTDVGVDRLLKLVNNYPLVTEYRLALGKMFLSDQRYQQAEEVFRQIIKLQDKPKKAYIELAKVLRAKNDTAKALDLLLKAAVLDPADANPLFLAGQIYLDMHKAQEALVQFQRVLTINEHYPLVHYEMGKADLMMNNPQAALAQTQAEKKVNPNLADPYLLAAEARIRLEQYSLCAVEYEQAIRLRPQSASIYVRLAQCYRKSGNLDAAIAMLNVAYKKESGLADIYKERGAIYEMQGDLTHAIAAYNQYFVLNPNAPDRSAIEQRISTLQNR